MCQTPLAILCISRTYTLVISLENEVDLLFKLLHVKVQITLNVMFSVTNSNCLAQY